MAAGIPRSTASSAASGAPPPAPAAPAVAAGAARPALPPVPGAAAVHAAARAPLATVAAAAAAPPVGPGPPQPAVAGAPARFAPPPPAAGAHDIVIALNNPDENFANAYLHGLPSILNLDKALNIAVGQMSHHSVTHLLRFHKSNNHCVSRSALGNAFRIAVYNDDDFVVQQFLNHILHLQRMCTENPHVTKPTFDSWLRDMNMRMGHSVDDAFSPDVLNVLTLDDVLSTAVRCGRAKVADALRKFDADYRASVPSSERVSLISDDGLNAERKAAIAMDAQKRTDVQAPFAAAAAAAAAVGAPVGPGLPQPAAARAPAGLAPPPPAAAAPPAGLAPPPPR